MYDTLFPINVEDMYPLATTLSIYLHVDICRTVGKTLILLPINSIWYITFYKKTTFHVYDTLFPINVEDMYPLSTKKNPDMTDVPRCSLLSLRSLGIMSYCVILNLLNKRHRIHYLVDQFFLFKISLCIRILLISSRDIDNLKRLSQELSNNYTYTYDRYFFITCNPSIFHREETFRSYAIVDGIRYLIHVKS